MTHIIKWIKYDRLMKRWDLDKFELRQVIESNVLPAFKRVQYFDSKMNPIVEEDDYPRLDLNDELGGDIDHFADDISRGLIVFKMDDIERIENENPDFIQSDSAKMAAKDAREFGQLKLEKKKWDKSIKAAVQATLFCKDQKTPVIRKQLWDHLLEKKLADIPDTTFEKIWKAIPQKYRSAGGRPSKAQTNPKTVT